MLSVGIDSWNEVSSKTELRNRFKLDTHDIVKGVAMAWTQRDTVVELIGVRDNALFELLSENEIHVGGR